MDVAVRTNPDVDKRVNANFRGKWINAENIGKTEAEIIALWNTAHPDDRIFGNSLTILVNELVRCFQHITGRYSLAASFALRPNVSN